MDCWTCRRQVGVGMYGRSRVLQTGRVTFSGTGGSTNYRHLLHVMIARVEKPGGLTTAVLAQAPPSRPQRPKLRVVGLGALLLIVFVSWHHADLLLGVLFLSATRLGRHGGVRVCPQADALYPERHAELWRSLGREFDEDPFMTRVVAWLGGAVRIPYV
jgi:hypothetical protein